MQHGLRSGLLLTAAIAEAGTGKPTTGRLQIKPQKSPKLSFKNTSHRIVSVQRVSALIMGFKGYKISNGIRKEPTGHFSIMWFR